MPETVKKQGEEDDKAETRKIDEAETKDVNNQADFTNPDEQTDNFRDVEALEKLAKYEGEVREVSKDQQEFVVYDEGNLESKVHNTLHCHVDY